MLKEQIINELFNSPDINRFIIKNIAKDLQDDFKQELFLIICEKKDAEIIELYELRKVNFWVARIMCNMCFSKNSKFFYQFVKKSNKYFPGPSGTNEELEIKTIQAMQSLNWYHAEILRLYADKGSCRKVQAETGISHKSIMNTVNSARQQIKKIVNG